MGQRAWRLTLVSEHTTIQDLYKSRQLSRVWVVCCDVSTCANCPLRGATTRPSRWQIGASFELVHQSIRRARPPSGTCLTRLAALKAAAQTRFQWRRGIVDARGICLYSGTSDLRGARTSQPTNSSSGFENFAHDSRHTLLSLLIKVCIIVCSAPGCVGRLASPGLQKRHFLKAAHFYATGRERALYHACFGPASGEREQDKYLQATIRAQAPEGVIRDRHIINDHSKRGRRQPGTLLVAGLQPPSGRRSGTGFNNSPSENKIEAVIATASTQTQGDCAYLWTSWSIFLLNGRS